MIIYKINQTNLEKTDTERVEANVKWYNPLIGYGFLHKGNGSEDIMIHFSALDKVSCAYIKPGDRIICDVICVNSGLQVSRIIEVKYDSQEPRSLSDFEASQSTPFDPESLEDFEGIIKWYKKDKKYGFIRPLNGGRDIFFHGSVLHATGYKYLEPGVRVLAKVSLSERGVMAKILTVIHNEKEQLQKLA